MKASNNIGHGGFFRLFGILLLIDVASTLLIVNFSKGSNLIILKYVVLGLFLYSYIHMGRLVVVNPDAWRKLHKEMAYNSFLERINHILVSDLEFQQVLKKFLEELKSKIPFDIAMIYRFDETCRQIAPYMYADGEEVMALNQHFERIEESFLKELLQFRQPVLITDLQKITRIDHLAGHEIQSLVLVPMVYQHQIHGFLFLASKEGKSYHSIDLNFLQPVAERLVISMANCILYEKTKELSLKDYLTNCPNRRALDLQLDYEYRRAKRYQEPFSILALDIDHFKKLNDLYGHLVGDKILQELADLMRVEVRDIDMVSRFGGEEFVILLPETNEEQAMIVAERIRKRVAENIFLKKKEKIKMTVSVGVASYFEDMDGIQELLNGADLKLYSAKESGRNQVVYFARQQESAASNE